MVAPTLTVRGPAPLVRAMWRDQKRQLFVPWNPVLNVNPVCALGAIADYGDLSINPLSPGRYLRTHHEPVERKWPTRGARAICVGGDHSILLPILRAVHRKFGPVRAGAVRRPPTTTWGRLLSEARIRHGTPVRPRRGGGKALLLEGSVLPSGASAGRSIRRTTSLFRPASTSSSVHHRGGVSFVRGCGPPAFEKVLKRFSQQAAPI